MGNTEPSKTICFPQPDIKPPKPSHNLINYAEQNVNGFERSDELQGANTWKSYDEC